MLLTTALPLLALASSSLASSSSSHAGARRGRHAEKARKANSHIGKRENGRMTYYDTSVGAGACGIVHQNSDWTVALNGDQLRSFGAGYPPPACGKEITISYNGKTATATVQDECPSQYCSWGQLDLSPGLFEFFATKDTGVINADWWFGGAAAGGDAPAPTTTQAAPPAETTSQAPAAETTSQAPVEASAAASVESSAAPVQSSSASAEATTTAVDFAVSPSDASSSVASSSIGQSSAPAATESASSERVSEDDDSLPWCDELPEEEEAQPAATTVAAAPAYTTAAAAQAGQAGQAGQGGNGGGEQAAPAAQQTTQQAAAAPAYTPPAAAPATGGEQSSGGGSSSEESLEEGEVWCDEEPVEAAPAPLVASAVCPDAGSIVLVQNSTILYNNTIAAFANFTRGLISHSNSSLLTSTNYTLPSNGSTSFFTVNGTELIQNTTALCYNATLFPVANISSWTNFTSLIFGGSSTAPGAEVNATRLLGLDGTVNGREGKNATQGFMGFLETLSQRRR